MDEIRKIKSLIERLEQLTVARGATRNEEEVAKKKIEKLRMKLDELQLKREGYTETGRPTTAVFIYPTGKVKKDVNFHKTWITT